MKRYHGLLRSNFALVVEPLPSILLNALNLILDFERSSLFPKLIAQGFWVTAVEFNNPNPNILSEIIKTKKRGIYFALG